MAVEKLIGIQSKAFGLRSLGNSVSPLEFITAAPDTAIRFPIRSALESPILYLKLEAICHDCLFMSDN